MKKSIKTLGLIVLAILLFFAIYKIITYKEPKFNKVELSKTNFVSNKTDMCYLDTIVSVGLCELGYDSVAVIIKPISIETTVDSFGDVTLQAYIKGKDNQYIIYIGDVNRREAINVLSHELIHLKQYKTKEIIIDNGEVYWHNNKIEFKKIGYDERPWEIDAQEKKLKLITDISNTLYSK